MEKKRKVEIDGVVVDLDVENLVKEQEEYLKKHTLKDDNVELKDVKITLNVEE